MLPPYLRQKLTDFFSGVARRIAEDEEAFRGRMEVMAGAGSVTAGEQSCRIKTGLGRSSRGLRTNDSTLMG